MELKKSVNTEDYVKWFYELSNKDILIAGGKGASLSEMYNAKFPVPPGFMITAQAFDYFLKKSGIKDKIKNIIESIEREDTEELDKKSKEIRNLIEAQEMPLELKDEILESYHILGSDKIDKYKVSQNVLNILKSSYEPLFVSVRSSATTEDLADASFAGQQESFLNVKGDRMLIEKIKKCFSSLYTPRAIYYRSKKGFGKTDALLAVVIQKMVDSEKSGVVFSKDPTNQSENIIIEAVYGLGEGIVSGRINPDNYIVSRDLKIEKIKIADKKVAITRAASGENTIIKLTPEKSKSQVLSKGKIIEIANYAMKLEEHYKKAQDIEFAIESEKVYIVQSRPVTTLKQKEQTKNLSGNVLLTGQGASPGIGIGIVKIVKDLNELSKVKKGDVLVTEMTNPDMVVSMQRAIAIITNEGGLTSHAAIVSREMGIPAVVGTDEATSILKDGMIVTVDGTNGKVYEGEVGEIQLKQINPAVPTHKIKLKLILDLPDFVNRALQSKLDAVGLQRLEGIIASSGKHPLLFEKENKLDEYTEVLRNGIDKIAVHFNSIWIRSSDIRTDEFDLLKGAPEKELNPMLGFHGIRFSLKHPKIFEAELLAIKKVAQKYPDKKFGVMFPQIISAEEVKEAKEFFNRYKTSNMTFGIMVETPAAVLVIEEICKEGIDFISFGTNDLTQFTLAVDRGNDDVQYLYNELHPAIFSQIKKVIQTCKKYGVQTSICGQAGSKEEMVKFLFNEGINSISVNADAAEVVSNLVKKLEDENPVEKNSVEKFEEEREEYSRKEIKEESEEKKVEDEIEIETKLEDEIEKINDSEDFETDFKDDSESGENLEFKKDEIDNSYAKPVVEDDEDNEDDEDEESDEDDRKFEIENEEEKYNEPIRIIAELEDFSEFESKNIDDLDGIRRKAEIIEGEVRRENEERFKENEEIEEKIEIDSETFEGDDIEDNVKDNMEFSETSGSAEEFLNYNDEEDKNKNKLVFKRKENYNWYNSEYG